MLISRVPRIARNPCFPWLAHGLTSKPWHPGITFLLPDSIIPGDYFPFVSRGRPRDWRVGPARRSSPQRRMCSIPPGRRGFHPIPPQTCLRQKGSQRRTARLRLAAKRDDARAARCRSRLCFRSFRNPQSFPSRPRAIFDFRLLIFAWNGKTSAMDEPQKQPVVRPAPRVRLTPPHGVASLPARNRPSAPRSPGGRR